MYSPQEMREDKAAAPGRSKMPTRGKTKNKRSMPDVIDSVANQSKKPKSDFEAFLQGGLYRDNPGKRVLQSDEAEDITFTAKEVRAIKYPRHLDRLNELRKYELKQAG